MKKIIANYIQQLVQSQFQKEVTVDIAVPENAGHGDYSTNVAMKLSRELKKNPMEIADELKKAIIQDQKASKLAWLDRVEVVAPGFINLFVFEASLINEVERVLTEGKAYGNASAEHSEGGLRSTDDGLRDPEKAVKKGPRKPAKTAPSQSREGAANQRINPAKSTLSHSGKQKIMVEFAHPNTHKAFHIGHLRNITTGESLIRLFESQGHDVIRANYQGDVGMHIAKALYALTTLAPYKDEVQSASGVVDRVAFLGKAYAAGSAAFEEDEMAKAHIKDMNALVYASAQRFAKEKGEDPGTTDYLALVKEENRGRLDEIYELWKETRQWSLDYFETIYKRVGTHYDRLYFESECLAGADMAKDAVKKGVLKESDGAIILDGKPHGVDTRVFINSLGLPTYEGKELALARMQVKEYGPLDKLIHVLGPEQKSFTAVTFKAEELLGILPVGVPYHLTYGWVKLKHGKMSSRLGNVVLGEDIIEVTKSAIYEILKQSESKYSESEQNDIAEKAAIAAIKYSFLKVATNSEIAFDIEESINTHGDSGPYLQYTYARAKSVLRKGENQGVHVSMYPRIQEKDLDIRTLGHSDATLHPDERLLARAIAQFPDIVADAATSYAPSTLATYLFALAQQFNAFYAGSPIAGNDVRVALTAATAQVLKNGLYLLGIETLEQM